MVEHCHRRTSRHHHHHPHPHQHTEWFYHDWELCSYSRLRPTVILQKAEKSASIRMKGPAWQTCPPTCVAVCWQTCPPTCVAVCWQNCPPTCVAVVQSPGLTTGSTTAQREAITTLGDFDVSHFGAVQATNSNESLLYCHGRVLRLLWLCARTARCV